ncbi:hypothetical protein Bhyg_14345, partial [Pseudolycoriella hygida]
AALGHCSVMVVVRLLLVEIISFVIFLHFIDGNPVKFLYVDYLHCQFNPKFIAKNASCKLTFINRTHKAFTLKLFSLATITADETIHFQLCYRYRTGWRTFLVNFKDNYCDYVTKGNIKSTGLNLLIPVVRKYSNVKLKCPYVGPYIINEMPANAEMFNNPFIPIGKYYLNVTLAYLDELMFSMQFYFIVPEGRSIENDALGR